MGKNVKSIRAALILVALTIGFTAFIYHSKNETLDTTNENSVDLNPNIDNPKDTQTNKNNQFSSVFNEDTGDGLIESLDDAGNCGFDSESFYESIQLQKIDISRLSKKQFDAFTILESQCDSWYDYIQTLPIAALEKLRQEEEKRNKKIRKYILPEPSDYHTKKVINNLKNRIDKESDFDLLDFQIVYLLMHDSEIQNKLTEKLGFSVINDFITVNAPMISTLFLCQYNDCGRNSINMLSKCTRRENACGLSMQAYLQSTSSAGQYLDWQNTIIALREILHSDWFQNR